MSFRSNAVTFINENRTAATPAARRHYYQIVYHENISPRSVT
ncbi:hypothetical protein [Jeotgalicoccus halotolerans]